MTTPQTGGKTQVILCRGVTYVHTFDAVINVVPPQKQDNQITLQHCDQDPTLTPEKIDADEPAYSPLTFDAVYDPNFVAPEFDVVIINLPKYNRTRIIISDGVLYGGAQTYTVNGVVWARYTINTKALPY